MSFNGLVVLFCLMVNNVPFFGCTTVHLPIQFLKDILVVWLFWQSWIKLPYICHVCITHVHVFVWKYSSTHLDKYQEVWLLNHRVFSKSSLIALMSSIVTWKLWLSEMTCNKPRCLNTIISLNIDEVFISFSSMLQWNTLHEMSIEDPLYSVLSAATKLSSNVVIIFLHYHQQ